MLTHPKILRYIALGVMGILAAAVLWTFPDYGVTWDEELQSRYGLAIADYYISGFKDMHFAQIYNLYLYGGMFDGLAAFIETLLPLDIYAVRHLLNALFGLLGLWGTWRLGRFLGGDLVGLIALVLCASAPSYYGHMFNNPKDIPFAAGIVWTIYFMSRYYAKPQSATLLKIGIVLGLTLGIRVGGAMILAYWLLPMGIVSLRPLLQSRNIITMKSVGYDLFLKFWRVFVPVALLSYAIMLVCWPWAQLHPIANPLKALSEFSNFPQDVEVLLDGQTYRSTELPWTYVPLYFGIQLPEIFLFLLAAALFLLPRLWARFSLPQKQSFALLSMMAAFPVVYAVLAHPALYDTVRHFTFAVPLLCVVAALAAREMLSLYRGLFNSPRAKKIASSFLDHSLLKLLRHPREGGGPIWSISKKNKWDARLRGHDGSFFVTDCVLGVVFLCAIGIQALIMARLHPYEYIYVNAFAGGVPGAFGRYETDYWGSSFKEAAERLQAYVEAEGGVPAGKIYDIAICGPWDSAMIYLPPNFKPVIANEPAEFFLSTTRWMCQNMRPGDEIARIERLGVPLSVVKDLRKGYAYYEGNKNLNKKDGFPHSRE